MQLSSAQKCIKRVRVRQAYRCIIQSRFDARSPVMTHRIWLNVCRDCKVEWCSVLPSPTNWWASCCLMLLPATVVVSRPRFSITKGVARIYREWFDLESRNFTGTSALTWSTATSDVTWHATQAKSYRTKKLENAASDGFRWNFSRTVQARITKFYTAS